MDFIRGFIRINGQPFRRIASQPIYNIPSTIKNCIASCISSPQALILIFFFYVLVWIASAVSIRIDGRFSSQEATILLPPPLPKIMTFPFFDVGIGFVFICGYDSNWRAVLVTMSIYSFVPLLPQLLCFPFVVYLHTRFRFKLTDILFITSFIFESWW